MMLKTLVCLQNKNTVCGFKTITLYRRMIMRLYVNRCIFAEDGMSHIFKSN
jgi:hypothetical protein